MLHMCHLIRTRHKPTSTDVFHPMRQDIGSQRGACSQSWRKSVLELGSGPRSNWLQNPYPSQHTLLQRENKIRSTRLNPALESAALSGEVGRTGITNIGPRPGFAPSQLPPWPALNEPGPQFPPVKDVRVGFHEVC